KYIDSLPLRATRVYVWGDAAATLRERADRNKGLPDDEKTWAVVVSRQRMETVEAPYLEVTVRGTEPDAKTLMVTCHMDARSIVPEMSWGGDELWGVSAWLELVRWFRERPPKNHMRFVAFTGHWQDFAGSRYYVSEHLDEVDKKMAVVMGLDLSTEEKSLALVPSGWPQRGQWRGAFTWLERLIWYFPAQPRQNWTDDIKTETGLRARLMGDQPPAHPWVGSQMGPEELHNPASLAGRSYVSNETWLTVGGHSIAWQTAELQRPHHFTPLDTFEASYARCANLTGDDASRTGTDASGHVGQLEILFAFLDNISEIGAKYFPRGSVKRLGPDREGYLEFHGQIKHYDEKTAWYKGGLPLDRFGAPLENTFVYMVPWDVRVRQFQQTVLAFQPLVPNKQKHRGMQSYGVRYLAKVDADGRYRFPTTFYLNKFTRYTFVAFSLDDEGHILWAADLGRHGAVEFKYLARSVENWSIDQSITVFPCGSVALFDLYDRKRYSIGQNVKDTWYVQWTGVGQDHDEGVECYMPVSEVKLYPSQTDAKSYLIAQYRQTAMVFLPAETACEILMTRGVLKKFSLLRSLSSAPLPEALEAATTEKTGTPSEPEPPAGTPGKLAAAPLQGIRLRQGENRHVVNTPLVLARQMHLIDYDKKQHYDRFGVRSQEADVYFDNAARYITLAETDLDRLDETGFRANEAMAWRGESRAYQSIFRLLYDVVSTTIFYFTLLIPFSYLMERLLFPQSTYVRSAAVSGTVFLVFVLLLLKFHPGFRLAGNIYVTIVSFLIIVFTLPAFIMIISAGMKMLKAAGSQYFQRHASEAERLGVLTAALSLSVANMRRRKLRTALTLGTISLLVLSLVLLTHTTSTSTTYPTKEPPRDVKVGYDGIQVFNTRYHVYALLRELVDLMENMYTREATVLPRWYGYYGIRTGLKGWESVRLYGPYPETDYHFYDL
ncbi:MAG TPA: M28 family peptidase, partial [Planctomycetota bacterium]|nr:M28 family peptidase [Planctomycetota bacterium]